MPPRNPADSIVFASERLRKDQEVALLAVEHVGKVLLSASDELRENRRRHEAVRRNGQASEYASSFHSWALRAVRAVARAQ